MIDHDVKLEKLLCLTYVVSVQRLNGFVNYPAKCLHGISDVMEPIRQLTKLDVPSNWSKTQEDTFEAMKRIVSEAPVLWFYDTHKELSIQCDASQTGLGAALLQYGQPFAFVSKHSRTLRRDMVSWRR